MRLLALLAGLLVALGVGAQDYAREKRWADEITPAILVGDPVYIELTDEGHKFLSILAEGKSKDLAILIVHGVGVHPDHALIGALRTKLNDKGFTTLSIQMPVAKGEGAGVDDYYPALFPQAGNRIATAARYLQAKGYKRIVLASHSMGAWMSNVYLMNTPQPPFAAWVSIGVTGRFWGASLISIPWFGIEWFQGKIRLPVLDIYGERDNEFVLGGAKSRRAALDHIPNSSQVMIPGGNHMQEGREDAVVAVIEKFIATLPR
jgi:pimeloyl-ACP methyl ester carboxylesterase